MTDGGDAEQSQTCAALAEQGGKNHLPELHLQKKYNNKEIKKKLKLSKLFFQTLRGDSYLTVALVSQRAMGTASRSGR